jgi:hypothetical protein
VKAPLREVGSPIGAGQPYEIRAACMGHGDRGDEVLGETRQYIDENALRWELKLAQSEWTHDA